MLALGHTAAALSERLRRLAAQIPRGSAVADIGTDHGRLPLAAVIDRDARRVVAVDLRAEASPRTFLFAIAHHVLLGWVRDRQRAAARVDLGTVSAAALGPTPSSMLHAHRRERVLLEALRVLPLDAQIVLELTYFEEMSRADVAEVTGLPPGTVASRLRRARELLEVELVRRGAAPEPDPAELSASARALRASLSPDRGEPA